VQEVGGLGDVDYVIDDLGQFLLLVLADLRVAAESEV